MTLLIREAKWRKVRGIGPRLKKAAGAALAAASAEAGALTILLASDRDLRALNRDFRGRDEATNVLSFPAAGESYLGDIAIAYGVAAREARAAKKTVADHAVHLAVHGVLHLMGYDHVTRRQAKIMEPLEVSILARLGIADPYEGAA
ncbi:MAG: rRNA maturation RNase YbeY [Alphaproteobacteria bacterium]|nr:rRNA maturation RNase YbeY [Alphaproteobacteria bacterium]